jgi:glutamate 5-kinase
MALVQNRIVVKVGTSSLTNDAGNTNLRAFDQIALVLSDIANLGYEVILVSSGAIAVGSSKMGLKEKPKSMRMKQAAAALRFEEAAYLRDKIKTLRIMKK